MGSKKATGKNTLEGLVIPHKRDDNGKITGIAIRTNKGGLYLVAHNRMEGELLSQIHNREEALSLAVNAWNQRGQGVS